MSDEETGTDFHSLFIAMARSQKIPARFQIGFPILNAHAEKIDGLPTVLQSRPIGRI
jgi:transglutaminase-like putative cysteine protease